MEFLKLSSRRRSRPGRWCRWSLPSTRRNRQRLRGVSPSSRLQAPPYLSSVREPTGASQRRSSMSRLAWCASLALLLAACGSSRAVTTPSTSTTHGDARSTSTSTRITPSLVLRGIRVSSFECPPRRISPTARPAPIRAPQVLLLCPLNTPGVRSQAVTVTATQPLFTALIAALSARAEPPTTGACPAYGDLPQIVLAKTSVSVYQLSIPTDACGHYQHHALDALNRARRT